MYKHLQTTVRTQCRRCHRDCLSNGAMQGHGMRHRQKLFFLPKPNRKEATTVWLTKEKGGVIGLTRLQRLSLTRGVGVAHLTQPNYCTKQNKTKKPSSTDWLTSPWSPENSPVSPRGPDTTRDCHLTTDLLLYCVPWANLNTPRSYEYPQKHHKACWVYFDFQFFHKMSVVIKLN